MHAVERRWLGGAQIGPAIFELVPVERGHDAIVTDCGGERRHPVGGRGRGHEMLAPLLNPLYRPSGLARGDRHQHDIGEDRVLDAEAATGVRRRLQAQPVRRHVERHRHYRLHRQRPLEIGGHLVHALARQIFGDHHKPLDRAAGIARVSGRDRDPVCRGGKSGFGIAVAERAVADDVAPERRMQ